MQDRGLEALITVSIITGIAGIFILLRCISRFCIVGSYGLEDCTLVLAMALSIALEITIDMQRRYGLGRRSQDVPSENNAMLLKMLYISIIVYNAGLILVKFSLLYQYLRFFVERKWRRICQAIMAFVISGGIAIVFTAVFTCTPISNFWDRVNTGYCVNMQALWYFYASFNLLTDFFCWALPIPVLSKLDLPRRQKYPLILVFTLGLFCCIIGILRMYYLYRATISTDLTYDNVAPAVWSAIELNVGIICACVPALRPVVGLVFPGLRVTTATGRGRRSTAGSGEEGGTLVRKVSSATERRNDQERGVSEKVPAPPVRNEMRERDREVELEEGVPRTASMTSVIRVNREWSMILEVDAASRPARPPRLTMI